MANPNPSPSTRFQRGQPSANPSGRPKVEVDLMAILNDLLAAVDPVSKDTKARSLMTALIAEGIDGNVKATMCVLDRMLGRVTDGGQPTVDMLDLVTAVADRAAKRKAELALLDRKVKLADRALEGGDTGLADLLLAAQEFDRTHGGAIPLDGDPVPELPAAVTATTIEPAPAPARPRPRPTPTRPAVKAVPPIVPAPALPPPAQGSWYMHGDLNLWIP